MLESVVMTSLRTCYCYATLLLLVVVRRHSAHMHTLTMCLSEHGVSHLSVKGTLFGKLVSGEEEVSMGVKLE